MYFFCIRGCKIIQSASFFFAISISFKYSLNEFPWIVTAVGKLILLFSATNSIMVFFSSKLNLFTSVANPKEAIPLDPILLIKFNLFYNYFFIQEYYFY